MTSIQWDPEKARTNYRKHGVDFFDAVLVLEDPYALTIEDETTREQRYITLGLDGLGRLLIVVYTFRGEIIRVISARRATARERQAYEKGLP